MTRSNPVSWLARHTRRGVTDLPRNIVWAVDTTLKDPAKSAGRTVQSVGHQAASAVADVSPFGDGADSRLQRVDAALERARQLEAQAREKAEDARERAEAAAKVEADGDKQIDAARDEGEREVADVVAEAQREADEYVAAKRARARGDRCQARRRGRGRYRRASEASQGRGQKGAHQGRAGDRAGT